MSDAKANIKNLLKPSFSLLYSEDTAETMVALFANSTPELQLYIVGCLMLTLTASVVPQFTLLADRLHSMTPDGWPRHSLAEAGFFYRPEGGSSSGGGGASGGASGGGGIGTLVCFHCYARLPQGSTAEVLDDPLKSHRMVSPNCYYARLLELVRCCCSRHGDSAAAAIVEQLGVPGDARRYEKALRKLRNDLTSGGGIELAASFGFEANSLAVWATRHFMRHNGACPSRAGDLIALAHDSQGLFKDELLRKFDVRKVLDLLDLRRRVH